MSVTVSMHTPASAEVGSGGTHAWIAFKDASGADFSIFIPAEKADAAKAMVEYFNDFIAPPSAPPPVIDDFDDQF